MHELHSPRLSTGELEGARRDAAELVRRTVAGEDFSDWLSAMPSSRSQWVRDLARPTVQNLHFHAVRVAGDPRYLERVPQVLRVKVRQYADTLIRRRSSDR